MMNWTKTPDQLATELHRYAEDGKVAKVMREFKHGDLKSGSKEGPTVTSKDQALAIGLSEARKEGESVPPAHAKHADGMHPISKHPDQLAKELFDHLQQNSDPVGTFTNRAAGAAGDALGGAAGKAAGTALFA